MTDGARPMSTPHLTLVSSREEQPEIHEGGEALWRFVRVARRDLARLLRALVASGRSLAGFPHTVLSKIAHVDAVTARYLIEGERLADPEVARCAHAMRALEGHVVDQLAGPALAEVRRCEIGVRIDDADLVRPLVRTDWTRDDAGAHATQLPDPHDRRSLRSGIVTLDDESLAAVCRRLGIRVATLPWRPVDDSRPVAEQTVVETLLDGHLLSILIATLPAEAHRLLAALVREELDTPNLERLAQPTAPVGGRRMHAPAPVEILCGCALAFTHDGRLWVPTELHRRVDGVLRAFGI